MAGAREVSTFAIRFLSDETAFRRAVPGPVLLWEAPPTTREAPLLFATRPGGGQTRPSASTPLFFFVQKSAKNAFADEVTLGRTANNDITIEDNSVSRFHAYFAPDKSGGWSLIDAKSTAGTFVAGKRLEPKTPVAVQPGSMLAVGEVELRFLDPDAFYKYCKALLRR